MFNNVLLIEDNETTNYINKIVLRKIGVENVKEALNGFEAFKYLEEDCPDFIFLDLNMPVMDGWEFLKERETKALCENVKIAVLTSSTLPEDKKQAKKHTSVIAYIEKPLTEEKIQKLILN